MKRILIFCLLFSAAAAQGAEYEADITQANQALPGDVVTITPGTYAQTLTPVNSGTSAKPIIFVGYGVKLDGVKRGINLTGKSYIRVEGFEIRNCSGDGIRFSNSTGIEIIACNIHDIGSNTSGVCIAADNTIDAYVAENKCWNSSGYGMFFEENRGLIIQGNEIYNINVDGLCLQNSSPISPSDAQIVGNRIHDAVFAGNNHEDALQLWGSYDGLKILNNCISDFTQLAYICTPAENGKVWNVEIAGNTFYNYHYKLTLNGDTQGVFIGKHSGGGTKNISIHDNEFGFLGYRPVWLFDTTISGVSMVNNKYYAGVFADVSQSAVNVVDSNNTLNCAKNSRVPPRHRRERDAPENQTRALAAP